MNDQEQAVLSELRAHGNKLTQARRAVVHALATSPVPLSINDLYPLAREINEDVGLVTVYRTLELLVSLGLARPVHLMDNCHGYTLATPGHTHHLHCRQCHRVIEFDGCDLGPLLERIAQQTGYHITGHWLELEGLCARCQQASDTRPAG